ncbi:hypothetical protein CFH99_12105 [Nocardioides aromaticivorans]|uniref:DUF5655 domain-containing protein n=1 Tax=Nocardioides aromaticivorans TaxID=200618 RepID=A0ABX7PKM0_9ACTN|nr:DUF5655 domain-containing protein [Nocardioides aromaticivorans]QSR26368.1 hypothetical protein CFH99_12105 [Nocardioides aromaticivorans]
MTEAAADDFFDGDPAAWQIQLRILRAFEDLTDLEVRESASQVAYRHGRTFAIVWRPGSHLHSDVPLVLSLVLREPMGSPRFKEVVKVAGDTWMHHLDLRSAAEVDDELQGWIRLAWAGADRRVRH